MAQEDIILYTRISYEGTAFHMSYEGIVVYMSHEGSVSHMVHKGIQSNFDGSNPFGTMKICSRQR